MAIWPKPLASEPVFYYPPTPPYAGCEMQPGRAVESLHVPGDSLPRALWWGCEEAPPRSGEDMCLEMSHVPQLWGQVCGPGVRSNPSAEGWGHPTYRGACGERIKIKRLRITYTYRFIELYYIGVSGWIKHVMITSPLCEGLSGKPSV